MTPTVLRPLLAAVSLHLLVCTLQYRLFLTRYISQTDVFAVLSEMGTCNHSTGATFFSTMKGAASAAVSLVSMWVHDNR